MKKLSLTLPKINLLTIYKTFVRLSRDYVDIIQDKPLIETSTGAIKSTSHDCIYRELGLESFAKRRWRHKTLLFHKIFNDFYLYIYSHMLVTVVKEFVKHDQQIKTIFYKDKNI